MAWADSRVFTNYLIDVFENTTAIDLGQTPDTVYAALYNNTITPDNDVSSANSAYNVGQWATAQECFEAGQWAQAGVQITGIDISTPGNDIVMFDGADTASGSAADITNATGALVYDQSLATPVDNQGICYNYLGGPNSVVNGTFTVVWGTNGIYRGTL